MRTFGRVGSFGRLHSECFGHHRGQQNNGHRSEVEHEMHCRGAWYSRHKSPFVFPASDATHNVAASLGVEFPFVRAECAFDTI